MAMGAPMGGSGAPVDIRQTVDQDRGFVKKLELLIPGFRGYRQGEDARAADALLRLQVADRLKATILSLQSCREGLVQNNQYIGLTDIANAISDVQRLEGRIRHAEQGYSGIASAVRVNPASVDKLYEYDYGFVSAADQLGQAVGPIQNASSSGDASAIQQSVRAFRPLVNQLDQTFQARMRAIEGIQV
jgi:hypothetical protein